MQQKKLTASPEQGGMRCDAFVAACLPALSRSAAQHLAEQGLIRREGQALTKKDKIQPGDVVEVQLPDPRPAAAQAQEILLDIAYEDEDVIVVNKPKGMVVHPAAGNEDGTLVNALLHHCGASLSGIGGELRPGIVHRIDKDTSGLLIAAKNDGAHQALAAQLADHSLYREYEAVVLGNLPEDQGVIDAPIGRSAKDRKKMAVVRQGGRRAVTHYQVLGRAQGYTYIRCRLETGRTHQIRVHVASIGHPIAGDPLYGNRSDRSGLRSQCLHARRLTFVHPRTGLEMTVEAPLPAEFIGFLKKLGIPPEGMPKAGEQGEEYGTL